MNPCTLAAEPTWKDLVEIKQWYGFGNQSIANFIALHDTVQCDNFAGLLLNNDLLVQAIRREKQENSSFVQEVLRKWFAKGGCAVTCTWEALVECLKKADLDGSMIQLIKENTCKFTDNESVMCSMVLLCKLIWLLVLAILSCITSSC